MASAYSSNPTFRSDPAFPSSKRLNSPLPQIALFQSLFSEYSSLELTHQSDKPIAISSLAAVLARRFKTTVSYGIFQKYICRSLIWRRSGDAPIRPEINGSIIPSWSWMAYYGKIEFLQLEGGSWATRQLQFVVLLERSPADSNMVVDSHTLRVRRRNFGGYEIQASGSDHVLKDTQGTEHGKLWFDDPRGTLEGVKCVVMGKTKCKEDQEKYCVLLLREFRNVAEPGTGIYKRVGIGMVEPSSISRVVSPWTQVY
jgi:hypothetical protein